MTLRDLKKKEKKEEKKSSCSKVTLNCKYKSDSESNITRSQSVSNIRGSGHSVISLLFSRNGCPQQFCRCSPTGLLYLYQRTPAHITASSSGSQYRYWAQMALTNSTGDGILFAGIWPRAPALKPGSTRIPTFDPPVDSQVPKIKEMKSRAGESSKPHLVATWTDEPGEGTSEHTHVECRRKQQPVSSCKTSSGECWSPKCYVGLFRLALWSLQYPKLVCRHTEICLVIPWVHPGVYSSLVIPFREKPF